MDPRQYAEWLQDEVFLPTVIVIGTETAKTCIREANGMSLAELFAPFGGFYRRIPVSYNVLDKPMNVDAYRVRFSDADSAVQWGAAFAEQVGANMVEVSSPKPSTDARPVRAPSPWYQQWRRSMFRSLRWSEHEGLDQPAAALLVVSSKEEDPVFLFESLLHSSNLPPLCQQGVLDPVPARAAVLLHDMSDPGSPSEDALAAKLELVRARFVPHMAVALKVNSASGPDQEILDLFVSHAAPREGMAVTPAAAVAVAAVLGMPGATASPPLGLVTAEITCARLSREDLNAIAAVAGDVVKRSAVPWMETQLVQLEAQIAQNRKGLRNQFKYLWRKPRESASKDFSGDRIPSEGAPADATSGTAYPLGTVEGQMRLAGDLAFLLRDYEVALGYYKGVVTDFRQDRSWKHAGGAYEMGGICAYVTGMAKSEWDRSMDSAYGDYMKAGAGRHAMRVVCLQQAMMYDLKESAARLMRINSDVSEAGVRSALILEQAAQMFFRLGSARKATFHLVLAGHTFNKLQFKRLALHCYQSVASMYTSKQWYHITDHIYFTMARQAYGLGLLQESLHFFLALLNSFTSGDKRVIIQADRESTYLKEFLFVVRKWAEKGAEDGDSGKKMVDLRIPCIGPDVSVFLSGDDLSPSPPPPPESPGRAAPAGSSATPSPPSADGERWMSEPSVPWEVLGEGALSALTVEDRLELQWRDRRGDGKVFDSLQRVTPVGAEVYIEITVTNPMRVKLDISHVQLRGELVLPAGAAEADTQNSDTVPSVDFPSLAVSLGPLEMRRVRLTAIPRREGLLTIRGVSWSLFDAVHCEQPLRVQGRRLRATLQQRASKQGVYSTDRRLELKVRAQVPQLQGSLEGWPDMGADPLLLGELRVCTLVISTSGSGHATGHASTLRVTTSHPALVSFANPAGLGDCADSQDAARHEGHLLHCDFPALCCQGPEVRVPIAIRASSAGLHKVRFCLLAEGDVTQGLPKSEVRQWITIQHTLFVRASLICSVRYTPSYQQEGRMIFSCAMENRSQEVVQVDRVWCLQEGGDNVPLTPCSELADSQSNIGPGQQLQFLLAMSGDTTPKASDWTRDTVIEEKWSNIAISSRRRLLAASRAALNRASTPSERRALATATGDPVLPSRPRDLDLAVEWSTLGGATRPDGSSARRIGELYMFGVSRDRGGAPPCPLEMRLLAPSHAAPGPAPPAQVTLLVENLSAAGHISFYFIADASPGFLWLGCERSEVIRLPPQGTYRATLQACFSSPGVYDLNRLHFYVVGMPAGPGVVPCTEQAPLAFSFPFERLIQVVDA